MYLKCDLDTFELKSLEQKFDVILIEPPLEEYARSYGVTNVKFWDWDKIMVKHVKLSIYRRCSTTKSGVLKLWNFTFLMEFRFLILEFRNQIWKFMCSYFGKF